MNRFGTRKGYMSPPNLRDKSEVFIKRHLSHFWGSVVVLVPSGYYKESMERLDKILNTIYSGFLIQAVHTEKSSAFNGEALEDTYLTKPFYLTITHSVLVINHELPEISVKLEAREEVEVVSCTRIHLESPSCVTNPEMLQSLSDLRRYLSTFLGDIDFSLQVLPAFKPVALEKGQREEKDVQDSLTWERLNAYTKFRAISYSIPTAPTLPYTI